MTELHAGGKFVSNSYKVSGGLHGVGVSVVNALSEWLRLTVWRDGQVHQMEFRNGGATAPLKAIGATERRGTEVHFLASKEVFGNVDFHYDIIARRLRELSFLNNGVKIMLLDQRDGKEENFSFVGGVKGFVEYMNRAKNVLHPNVFHGVGEKGGLPPRSSMRPGRASRRARRAGCHAGKACWMAWACRASSPTARSAIRPTASSAGSRAIQPAAPPSRGATGSSRPSCRSRARS